MPKTKVFPGFACGLVFAKWLYERQIMKICLFLLRLFCLDVCVF